MMEEHFTNTRVCMTCLDTDREMFSMSKHNLNKLYEHLTGYQLLDMGNLKHTICEECMQKLVDFFKFRDLSLRARALLVDLVVQHEEECRFPYAQHHIYQLKLELQSEISVKLEPPDPQGLEEVCVKTESVDPLVEMATEVVHDTELYAGAECRVLLTRLSQVQESVLASCGMLKCENGVHECAARSTSRASGTSSSAGFSTRKHQRPTTSQPVASMRSRVANTDGARNHLDNNEAIKIKCEQEFKVDSVTHTSDAAYDMMHVGNQTTTRVELTTSHTTGPVIVHATEVGSNIVRGLKIIKANDKDNIVRTSPSSETYSRNLFICDSCHREFKRKRYLVKHIRSHCKGRLVFVCGAKPFARVRCQYRFKGKDDLSIPMRTTNTGDTPFACEVCQYKCSFRSVFLRHVLTHTDEKPFSCEICQSKFREKRTLVKHIRTHTGEKPYACEICQYRCSERTSLVKHTRTHTGEKPYACEICQYRCSERTSLVKHIRTHTGEKPFACEICQYRCSERTSLVKHMRKHTGEKPFACEICQYKCSERTSLVKHIRTHTGEKPYACEICQYRCSERTSLVKHKRTHTGEKPYACGICQYRVRQRGSLVNHMRKHTGEKPFACEICQHRCSVKTSLVNHMRTHTGEKPYACEICQYRCSQRASLVRHIRKHSGEKSFTCKV